jgi:prepilin-type N-terminal cleavage/methylation domain-containing protein
MGKNAKGFTLIEVLIASVIIITVLSLAAMSFSNARLNSEKASDTLKLLAPVPIIMDTIREQIRKEVKSDMLSGDGAIDGVLYSWQASLESAGSPPDNFDVEQGTVIRYKPRYKIYVVQLSMSSGTKSEAFEFKELAWLPRVEEVE